MQYWNETCAYYFAVSFMESLSIADYEEYRDCRNEIWHNNTNLEPTWDLFFLE